MKKFQKKLQTKIKFRFKRSKAVTRKYQNALSAAKKYHLKEGATSAKPAGGANADEQVYHHEKETTPLLDVSRNRHLIYYLFDNGNL